MPDLYDLYAVDLVAGFERYNLHDLPLQYRMFPGLDPYYSAAVVPL